MRVRIILSGLKIQVHVVPGGQLQISVPPALAHLIDGEHAVYNGGGRPTAMRGSPCWAPVEQGFKADFIVFVVEIHMVAG